nr:MAG TPA: Protein of unknown function (DUF3568) [Caudoviricetes sp.]
MKKVMSILLAGILLLSLAGCFSMAPTNGGGVKSASDESQSEPAQEAVTILDQDGIKISALGKETDLFGANIKLTIENNSGQDITVQVRDASVNGYMMDAILSEDVNDGKKSNCSMSFMSSELDEAGIEKIETVEFYFHIFNWDSMDTILDSNVITLEF